MKNLINVKNVGNVAICTLNLPAKRNPISPEMRRAILKFMDECRLCKSVDCIILTGSGNTFCSGLDLDNLQHQATFSAKKHLADSKSIRSFFEYIYHYPKPTIAAVNGPAVAGGCGLAMVCDIAIASTEAYFMFSEVKIGFVPALVGIYLERIAGPRLTREILFTARKVSSEEARAIGLVNCVCPASELLDQAQRLAAQICQNSPMALKLTKELLSRASHLPFQSALDLAVRYNARARRTSDCAEGIRSFLEKRKPDWSRSIEA